MVSFSSRVSLTVVQAPSSAAKVKAGNQQASEPTKKVYVGSIAAILIFVDFVNDKANCMDSVPKILRNGVIPLAVEYVDRDVIEMSAEYLGMKWPATKGSAHLVVIVSGANDAEVYLQAEQVSDICQKSNAIDILITGRRDEQANILKMGSEIYSAIKDKSADIS